MSEGRGIFLLFTFLFSIAAIAAFARRRKSGNEPLFVAVDGRNPAMQEAFLAARASFPSFWKAYSAVADMKIMGAVKIRIVEDEVPAYIWIFGITQEGDHYSGAREGVDGLSGERTFTDAEVYDWMALSLDGRLWGGYTIRVVREILPEERRSEFDVLQGVTVYEPLSAAVSFA